MHHCALFITKELLTEDEICYIMKPYCGENTEYKEIKD